MQKSTEERAPGRKKQSCSLSIFKSSKTNNPCACTHTRITAHELLALISGVMDGDQPGQFDITGTGRLCHIMAASLTGAALTALFSYIKDKLGLQK